MILLDAHALVRALMAPDLLSEAARAAIVGAGHWGVSGAGLCDIRSRHGLGQWPEVAAICGDGLDRRLADTEVEIVPADGPIMDLGDGMGWAHRDPFDRIIVATCVIRTLPLVSKDEILSGAPAGPLVRIW